MRLQRLKEERGSILLFTTIAVVPLMIIFSGLAMDVAYYVAVDNELQRAMDACALAGAGTLGADAAPFSVVRLTARDYALSNRYRAGTGEITLDLNPANLSNLNPADVPSLNPTNDPSGNIVLGFWTPLAFTPWLEPPMVNAVLCQYRTNVPTSFLMYVGIDSLTAYAQAIAISTPGGAQLVPLPLTGGGGA